MRFSTIGRAIALANFSFASVATLAQGVATESQLAPIVVIGVRSPLDPNLPATTATKTAEQLREQNIFNAEDALNLLPALSVRKRYLGDRNANVGGRTHGVLQPGRSLVYLDGYLISNFLGRFDAPRWNMVSPEALTRVDALYGPFSAIFPGNSVGSTIIMTERTPKAFEVSASVKTNHQNFSEYLSNKSYASHVVSARVANVSDQGLWWAIAAHRQDSQGHPMGYANVVQGTASQFGAPTLGTRVTGISKDLV